MANVSPENRAVRLLEREVPAWSRENKCFSCHNNGDAARALYAAGRAGRSSARTALRDTTAWVLRPDKWEHNHGDPGFSDQRLADLQFASSLLALMTMDPGRDTAPLGRAVRQVAAAQSADGTWAVEPHNAVGSPATWGTSLATYMGWRILTQAGEAGEITRGHAQKAEAWLRQMRVDTVPAAAVKLMGFGHEGAANAGVAEAWEYLRRAQTREGGWGPYADAPAEVFDTSLAVLGLVEMRTAPGVEPMIIRGREFLVSMQESDGGWPATTRPSGGDSYAQRMSTIGWATLALLGSGRVGR